MQFKYWGLLVIVLELNKHLWIDEKLVLLSHSVTNFFFTIAILLYYKILFVLHLVTISSGFPYIIGPCIMYISKWPSITNIIVTTFIPCITFKSLFLSNLIRSLPFLIIENEYKTVGILAANPIVKLC